MKPIETIPVLRIFDEQKAREFYIDFLGFAVDWQHRFADDFPLYMQISMGACHLHLTELTETVAPAAPSSSIRQSWKRINRACWQSDTGIRVPAAKKQSGTRWK